MTTGAPAVVVRVGELLLALDSAWATEMIQVPPTTRLAGAPHHVRGVAERRGRTILILDLRQRLGMESLREEAEALVELLDAREADHVRWVEELEACVREGRTFRLALDPHACAFGKWYDSYRAPNLVLESHLRHFEDPHAALHHLGGEVVTLVSKGRGEEALRRIAYARDTICHRLRGLFAQARELVRDTSREIAVVHEDDVRSVAFTVDAVESVETLAADAIQHVPTIGLTESGLLTGTARLAHGDRLALLLNAPALVAEDGLA